MAVKEVAVTVAGLYSDRWDMVPHIGSELEDLEIQDFESCLTAIRKSRGLALEFVREQTLELCMAAVKLDGMVLAYVRQQTAAICMAAVRQNGIAVKYVKEQTPEVCIAAVQNTACALGYVREQTPEICFEAVVADPEALRYVRKQTQRLCMIAVQEDYSVLSAIRDEELRKRVEILLYDQQNAMREREEVEHTVRWLSTALVKDDLARVAESRRR